MEFQVHVINDKLKNLNKSKHIISKFKEVKK